MLIVYILLGALLLYAVAVALIFHIAFASRPRLGLPRWLGRPAAPSPWETYRAQMEEGMAWFRSQPLQQVWITAGDGARLRGRYLACPGSNKAILLVHGYRSASAESDFACALKLYHRMDLNILLVDQRGQGESQGKLITFGILEREDVAAWARWLDRTYHPRSILLDGMSMGASSVLMALALPLPPSVKGAIADCGFTSPRAIIAQVMRQDYRLPPKLLMPGLNWLFRLRTGHSLDEASVPQALAASRLPVLLIHGEADRYVPFAMGRENAQATPLATLASVPGAGHGVSFLVDREKCEKALDNFIARVIQ